MCTAICLRKNNSYFGRSLDVESSRNERITIVPRNFLLELRHSPPLRTHFAIIGTAYIEDSYPLYYDAINEHGLCIAALKYGEKVIYPGEKVGFENIASFELIPKILGTCKDLSDVKAIFKNLNIINENYCENLKATPLHWIISDTKSSIVAEPFEHGIRIYENPPEILTNAPEFNIHLENWNKYFSEDEPTALNLPLPGDSSPESRFIRTAYNMRNAQCLPGEEESVGLFFRILENVTKIKGCGVTPKQRNEMSVYFSCYNINNGIYYYRTYNNSRIYAVDMHRENLDGKFITSYRMIDTQEIFKQN